MKKYPLVPCSQCGRERYPNELRDGRCPGGCVGNPMVVTMGLPVICNDEICWACGRLGQAGCDGCSFSTGVASR